MALALSRCACPHLLHLVPDGHALLGNVPHADFAIERARDEVAVVLGHERDARDEVDVLEGAEALVAREVPQFD
jgi:hypothetical protein